MTQQIDLSGLKDIHVPVQPDIFPLAVGWWVVLICCLIIVITAVVLVYHFRFSSKSYAKRLLKKEYETTPNTRDFALKISLLFKRIVLIRFPREEVASLTDTDWADFIQRVGKGCFSVEMARFVAQSAYLPPVKKVAFSNKKLYNAAIKWIDIVFKGSFNERKRK